MGDVFGAEAGVVMGVGRRRGVRVVGRRLGRAGLAIVGMRSGGHVGTCQGLGQRRVSRGHMLDAGGRVLGQRGRMLGVGGRRHGLLRCQRGRGRCQRRSVKHQTRFEGDSDGLGTAWQGSHESSTADWIRFLTAWPGVAKFVPDRASNRVNRMNAKVPKGLTWVL
jgi:hypothetical protein